ncbi:unnamed protein product [Leptidea sinapis]|uniref:Enoyl reductase (ER) domain-containing protein n=1 Tax=Leptidea sinapis TaxID=189913 RepID=A0A5E4Q3E4_9NEOP|nr:unnamed protein product [Leptidea sinapis]
MYEKIPVPAIDNNEVLIKIECVGICGSDLKMYSTGRCGLEVVTKATVMGHEGAGTVLQVGKNVKNVRIGDRVAIEPTQPCRACEFCRGGRYNVIPDNVSMEEGAAVQPLAIAIHACNRAGIRLGSTVAIMGAGPIGVLCAMTARAMGATTILITGDAHGRNCAGGWHRRGDRGGAADWSSPAGSQHYRRLQTAQLIIYPTRYPAAISAVSTGAVDLKSFITHHFPLEKAKDAFELAKSGEAMKIIIHVDNYTTPPVARTPTINSYNYGHRSISTLSHSLVDVGSERDVGTRDVVGDHQPLGQQPAHHHLPQETLRVAAGPALATIYLYPQPILFSHISDIKY